MCEHYTNEVNGSAVLTKRWMPPPPPTRPHTQTLTQWNMALLESVGVFPGKLD